MRRKDLVKGEAYYTCVGRVHRYGERKVVVVETQPVGETSWYNRQYAGGVAIDIKDKREALEQERDDLTPRMFTAKSEALDEELRKAALRTPKYTIRDSGDMVLVDVIDRRTKWEPQPTGENKRIDYDTGEKRRQLVELRQFRSTWKEHETNLTEEREQAARQLETRKAFEVEARGRKAELDTLLEELGFEASSFSSVRRGNVSFQTFAMTDRDIKHTLALIRLVQDDTVAQEQGGA